MWRVVRRAPEPPADRLRVVVGVVMVVVGALTVLGLVALWPRGDAPDLGVPSRDYVDATVTDVQEATCPGIEVDAPGPCLVYDARLTSGPDDGETIPFAVSSTQFEIPELEVGDDVVLAESPNPDVPDPYRYSFSDLQRSSPLLWLVGAFVIVVVAFGRLQGLRALAGLAMSMAVLVLFVVPALLRDSPAVLVALVGTVAVAYAAIYLAHGFRLASSIALAGTLVSLAVTTLLAMAVASVAHLSGLASQEAQALRVTADALDLRGLLIAGIVVGALGVLDDVTVSQVSTVAALRRANPMLTARQLYAEATRVGRDHVASTVNTLALAYAGASLPLLLFFAQGTTPVSRVLTGELVAVEIVRMLVGSIGLVLSVPVTTRLAAVILTRTSTLPGDDGHAHAHTHGPASAGPPGVGRRRGIEPPSPNRTPSSWDQVPAPHQDESTTPWF
jgi:uncharacterized membrane protein